MAEPIVLYDIPSNDRIKRYPWSPNTWKTRYALNIKGLKYRTEWVEYPDIEGLLKKFGVPHTEQKPDGRDHYTLPVIYDPKTQRFVEDSGKIAKYLDDAYPDTPRLFPAGTDAFQAAFHDFVWPSIGFPLFHHVILDTAASLPPRSQAYFRATREVLFGKPLEQIATDEEWLKLEANLASLRGYLDKNGEGSLLLMGAHGGITHSDIQVASMFVWARVVWGEDSEKWKRLMGLHDGRWAKLYAQFSKFEQVDS
ncbi:glutathione S-transferase [Phanerochaete sordida]|uniref:Glutathione S-transferase n=1 Tax=Phanerochaete sordida TaxID=48140 RepID=A0A9P3GSW2_9APHY|nr:glutathione S-transferase [Phanerochaete sordida]